MKRFEARAPTRIDFAGGTLDLWPIYLLVPRAVTLNVAIDLYARASIVLTGGRAVRLVSEDLDERCEGASLEAVRRRGRLPLVVEILAAFGLDRGVEVTTQCDAPAGSGLGGSSALAIALCGAAAAATGRRIGRDALLAVAKDLEARILGVPTGDQDYIAAIHGGLSAIHYGPGGARVRRVPADLDALGATTTLVFTDQPHRSGINNWEVYRRFIEGDRTTRQGLAAIGAIAARAEEAAARGAWRALGARVAEEGALRGRLWRGIETARTRRVRRVATDLGAWGAKVCGAGGGGCMTIQHPAGRGPRIRAAVEAMGLRVLDVRPVGGGMRVRRREAEG